MSDSHLVEELQERLKLLESELNVLKRKKTTEPHHDQNLLPSHDFKVELPDGTEARAVPMHPFGTREHEIGGVLVNVELYQDRENDPKIACCVYVRNAESKSKSAIVTTSIRTKLRHRMSEREPPYQNAESDRFIVAHPPIMQRYVLGPRREEGKDRALYEKGNAISFDSRDTTFYVLVTVRAQVVDPISLDDSNVIVVVQGKEITVSAPYLATWSGFFRAYFSADMKEKREGRYPIKDANITAIDFEEMMLVILPSDKPVSEQNYAMLLRMADRFEMPELQRRVELFLLDFSRNGLKRGAVYRLATEEFQLKIVESALLERWNDFDILQKELMMTEDYKLLAEGAKATINEKFALASIAHMAHNRLNDARYEGRGGGRYGRGRGGGYGGFNDREYAGGDYSDEGN